ncbi:MAG: transaldolase family protein [Giesbergeria sp.]
MPACQSTSRCCFRAAQYQAAAEAYLRGIERRVAAGLDPKVSSVASLFVSRWDVAANKRLPGALHNRLGIAVAAQTYRAYRELLAAPRWHQARLRWRACAAPAVGEYRHKRPCGARHPVRRGAGRARHHQYPARKNAVCVF